MSCGTLRIPKFGFSARNKPLPSVSSMSKKVVLFPSNQSFSLGRYAAVLFVCTLLSSALAQQAYLPKGRPDSVALLPPPPELGTAEQAADLASARAVFK